MQARGEDGSRDPIDRVVGRTRAGMALERALRAFWPLAALAAATWAALAFGLAETLARPALIGALGAVGLGFAALVWRGAARFAWPRRVEALARVDAQLPGRPLAALTDTPALGRDDPASQAVWSAHMAQMRRLAAAARPIRPDLRLARHDPWALRLAALTALIAAVAFTRGEGVSSVAGALAPAGAAAVATGPSFEAWVEPPAYTGRPTLYLPELPPDPAAPVPQGSVVTVRVYGEAERFALTQTVDPTVGSGLAEAAPGIAIASFAVETSGSVGLAEGSDELGAWSFIMQPDAPPTIALAEPVTRAPTGETQLTYSARDDYGVVAARAEITLDLAGVDRRHGLAADPEPRAAIVLDLPAPIAREAAEVTETHVEDLSKHPWAGLPVMVRLTAEDATGQTGAAEAAVATLPGRRFYNPVAAALVEQRRDLLWTPTNAPRVVQVLRAVTYRPEGHFPSPRAYLATRIAIRRLEAAAAQPEATKQIEEIAEMLWRAALLLEEGSLGDAAERLARAKERLREALRSDASDEEIAQLMDELREATRDYMQQLAEESIRNGDQQAAAPPPGQSMSQDQIQALMDRIQELSEQGRRAEAEALLEMLQQLLENLEMRQAQGGGGEGQGGEGEQSMQDLNDALREQQGLADDSFQELQRQFREGRAGRPGEGRPGEGRLGQGRPGENGEAQGQAPNPSGEAQLAERQEALRRLMEQLQQSLPGEAGEAAREALREAERNMGEATRRLREDDASGALDRQSDAIDDLREGMRAMAEDLRQGEGGEGGRQAGAEGDGSSDGRNDPLGRPLGAQGGLGTNETMLQDGDLAARARGLLDEIRRRSGERARPQLELDYLRRLLDRF